MSLVLPTIALAVTLAQAESAPARPREVPPDPGPTPVATADDPDAPPPSTLVGFSSGIGVRLGNAARDLPPPVGFSFDLTIARVWARLGEQVALAVQVDFGFERYTDLVEVTKPSGAGQQATFDSERRLSFYDFTVLQTASVRVRRIEGWAGAGGGLDVSYFRSGEERLRPGELRAARAVAHAAAGASLALSPTTSLGLRVDGLRPIRPARYTAEGGARVAPFGDRLLARLALLYRF